MHRRNIPLRRKIMLSWQRQNRCWYNNVPPNMLRQRIRKALRRVPHKYAKFARELFRQYFFVRDTDEEIDLRVRHSLGISERTYRNWRTELTTYMESKNARTRRFRAD